MKIMFLFILPFAILSSCNSEEKLYINYRFSKKNTDISNLEVGFKMIDTLKYGVFNYGEFVFSNPLHDTIELTDKDFRNLHVLVKISKEETPITIKQLDTFRIFSRNFNEQLIEEFKVLPDFKGESTLTLNIEESILLYAERYRTDNNNRLIHFSYTIDYPIYVD